MDWDRANEMNLEQMELLVADTTSDLEEDREILSELQAGGDVRVVLERWIDRAIRQREATLRDIKAHLVRFKAVIAQAAAEREGGP